jgi:hypothetical protein
MPGAGVVALTPDNRLVAASAEAQAWLDDLVPGGDDQTYPSDVTRVLFDAAHALRRGDLSRASTCLRTVSGHWLRVEATALAVDEADVAVVLQPATVQQLLGTLAACNKLTARESEVLGLLAHGLAGKQIASQMTELSGPRERVRAAEPPSNAATEWIVRRPDWLCETFRSTDQSPSCEHHLLHWKSANRQDRSPSGCAE